jgi:hypothetical protein
MQYDKIRIINLFSTDFNAYMSTLRFMNAYIEEIDRYLDTAVVSEGENRLPFAILGSTVHVLMPDGNVCKYRITLPDKESLEEEDGDGIKSVSCLSKTGGSLVFKEVSEEVLKETELAGKVEKIDIDLLL